LNGAPSGPFTVPVIVAPCAKVERTTIALTNASIFGMRCMGLLTCAVFPVKSFIKNRSSARNHRGLESLNRTPDLAVSASVVPLQRV
jgi:hypothetical protein